MGLRRSSILGFVDVVVFLGFVVNLYGPLWVFLGFPLLLVVFIFYLFLFFPVVVAKMDMGMLVWDGSV